MRMGHNTNKRIEPPWHKLHFALQREINSNVLIRRRCCDHLYEKTNVSLCFDVLHGQASSTLSLMSVAFVPPKTERLQWLKCSWVKKLTSYLDLCALQVGWYINEHAIIPAKSRRRRRRSETTSAGQSLYARILYSKIQLLILILISNNNSDFLFHEFRL